MRGLNGRTGVIVDGDAHLAGCIQKILTTPIGSRVMRRGYGSWIPRLIDQPMNRSLPLQIFGAAATALLRSDPKLPFKLRRVSLKAAAAGSAELTLEGVRTDRPTSSNAVRLTVPIGGRGATLSSLALA